MEHKDPKAFRVKLVLRGNKAYKDLRAKPGYRERQVRKEIRVLMEQTVNLFTHGPHMQTMNMAMGSAPTLQGRSSSATHITKTPPPLIQQTKQPIPGPYISIA
jgi:hypothetical protein